MDCLAIPMGESRTSGAECMVPTLFRLLFVVGVLVALIWGAMQAMVTYLAPHPREITRDVPLPARR